MAEDAGRGTDQGAGGFRRPAVSKRLQGMAIGLAAGSLLACGVAVASIATPAVAPAVIHGCISNRTRLLTVPRAGHRCPSGTVAVSWNSAGRQGPAGPAGAAGWGRILSAGGYGFASPNALAFDGSHIWVANVGDSSVTEVNASNGAFVRSLSGGGFSQPHALAFDGGHLWAANVAANSVTELPPG